MRFLVKLNRAEEITVVRHRQGGHVVLSRLIQQLPDRIGPVQKTVLGMNMEMGEIDVFFHESNRWQGSITFHFSGLMINKSMAQFGSGLPIKLISLMKGNGVFTLILIDKWTTGWLSCGNIIQNINVVCHRRGVSFVLLARTISA